MKPRTSFPKIHWPKTGIHRRKIRLLYKIWAFSIPLTGLTLAACIMKMINSCWGGCPFIDNKNIVGPDGHTYTQAIYGPTDWTTGAAMLIIPLLIGVFLVYAPGYIAGYWEPKDK